MGVCCLLCVGWCLVRGDRYLVVGVRCVLCVGCRLAVACCRVLCCCLSVGGCVW